jgi:hypothetical protein
MGAKTITNQMGYQQITSLSSAQSLTVPAKDPNTGVNQKPAFALITPETQAVRYRDDGTPPTATVGMPVAVGTTLRYDGDLSKIQFIEQTASAKLNIVYYA